MKNTRTGLRYIKVYNEFVPHIYSVVVVDSKGCAVKTIAGGMIMGVTNEVLREYKIDPSWLENDDV